MDVDAKTLLTNETIKQALLERIFNVYEIPPAKAILEDFWRIPVMWNQQWDEIDLEQYFTFEEFFTRGACAVLVNSLVEQTGGKVRVWSLANKPNDEWWGHAALHVDDNLVIDALGVRTLDEVRSTYPHFYDEGTLEEVMTITDFNKKAFADEASWLDWEKEGKIERILSNHFAEYLLKTHKVT